MRPRVIPIVLVSDQYVVKTTAFKKPVYVGDPINTVKLFNDKQADELFILDINATRTGRGVDFEFVKDVVSEAFMPVAYGGGVSSMKDAARLFELGVEKVVIHDACFTRPEVIAEMSRAFGAQAVVAAVDIGRHRLGRQALVHQGAGPVEKITPEAWAQKLEDLGAGEILLTSMQREGSRRGFDLDLIARISSKVRVPVVANGGANSVADFAPAVRAGASAIAGGTMFTFHGPRSAVLIQYPTDAALNRALGSSSQVTDLATLIERNSGA